MVSSKDIALVGGLGILAFIILRGGKDLFNALPTLGAGLGETGQGILDFGGQAGAGIKDFFGIGSPEIVQLLDTPGNPANNPQFPTPIDVALANNLPLPQPTPGEIASDPNRDPTRFNPPGVTCFGCEDSPEGIPISMRPPGLPSGFEGGGPSFIGGSISEIPLANLNLSGIIDRFGVTASQAANIQAQAQDNFGNFDFGTNTGTGIGSVFADSDIASQLPAGNVSDPRFAGLTATEIMQRILGGNINN